MDVTLQKHGAKHVYRVPEGLRELCTDITREVLRSQPREMYSFIADYMDVLLITRENAKVAVKVVNNILQGSETIMNILYRTGLSIEQIAAAAPRIQKAFRTYLDIIDGRQDTCEDEKLDEKSRISLRDIFQATGINAEQADKAATIIQAAFRGHRSRMLLAESQGKIQWQRALMNTLDILKKSGVPAEEITKSIPIIETAYRGYYTSRNLRIQMKKHEEAKTLEMKKEEEKKKTLHGFTIESGQTVQAVAWLEMVYEDSKLSFEVANNAAMVIQKAYNRHRMRKGFLRVQKVISSRSLVVEGILDVLRQNVFDKVISRDDIPEEFGTREDMEKASKLLQQMYKDHLKRSRISIEEDDEEMDTESSIEMRQLNETIEKEEEKIMESSETSKIEDDEISIEDPAAGESINVESSNVAMEKKIERNEEQVEEEQEEMSHETTSTNDTAG